VFSPGSEPFIGAGTLSLPHWRALGHADWQRGPWSAGYQVQYIGGYRDLSAGYALPFGLQLRAAVTNLFDTNPPFVNFGTNANTDAATYRLLGRGYVFGLRYRWK
jgi:outer membrane receptor protein involved in Fe transport